jgi:hypothetical protein
MMLIVPSVPIVTQALASNEAERASTDLITDEAPSLHPMLRPAAPTRTARRLRTTRPFTDLPMISLLNGTVDRAKDARVCAAPAEVRAHVLDNLIVGWVGTASE